MAGINVSDKTEFNQNFLQFLSSAPTPFHAVSGMVEKLAAAGFTPLRESDAWKIVPGAKHYVLRGDSSLVAFEMGSKPVAETGFRMVAAHSDSPCLKVKPNPEIASPGPWRLGVEVYGSAILSTWFDRELSVAGRVILKDEKGVLQSALVDVQQPVALIPNLAIHLNRNVNKERCINEQIELPAVWTQGEKGKHFRAFLADAVRAQHPSVSEVVEYDISFYDRQPAKLWGLQNEFIASGRLDNLASCFTGLMAFLNGPSDACKVFVAFDHEEVGSRSHVGAQSSFLSNLVLRLAGSVEDRMRALSRSVLVSADNAHALHPSFPDRMDPQHAPRLNAGPVLKSNCNQSYATNPRTAALFQRCAEQAKVQTQRFVVRTDMGCGSTVGPIVASQLGIDTVDVGIPQWAMHSCRETMGSDDSHSMFRAMQAFYSLPVSEMI
jgi:aspartyl aminopeptidase